VGIVAGGYLAAFAIAYVFVWVYALATSGPDRQTYAAMYDFGDLVLFLAVSSVAAVPATGAALYFSRPYRSFWRVLSTAALTLAAAELVTLLTWSPIVPLEVFVAPLLGSTFLLAAIFAPTSSARRSLVVATALEAVLFVSVVYTWATHA